MTMDGGTSNWPGSVPLTPHDLMNTPFLSNLAMREFREPSATKISPAASQATSEGPLKLSPGTPAPLPGAGGASARGGLLTASGFLPMVISTRPSGSNLMIMLEPSSTTQILS